MRRLPNPIGGFRLVTIGKIFLAIGYLFILNMENRFLCSNLYSLDTPASSELFPFQCLLDGDLFVPRFLAKTADQLAPNITSQTTKQLWDVDVNRLGELISLINTLILCKVHTLVYAGRSPYRMLEGFVCSMNRI